MLGRPVEQLTLRELFIDAERLTRELIEHVEQGFLPKAHSLEKLVRVGLEENALDDVRDVTVRNRASELLESEKFTGELCERAEKYFAAIDASVNRILEE